MSFLEQELKRVSASISTLEGMSDNNDERAIIFKTPKTGRTYQHYKMLVKGLAEEEKFIIALALAPHVNAHYLTPLIAVRMSDPAAGGSFERDGASSFQPTVSTVMYLLNQGKSPDAERSLEILTLFDASAPLISRGLIQLDSKSSCLLDAKIEITTSALHRMLWDRPYVPPMSGVFPAERITTKQEWDDLVVARKTKAQMEEALRWLRTHKALQENETFNRKTLPGFRTLFYGPSGTGKTLAVTLLGKRTGMEVYRVDISKLVSKYIGETEKNLKRVFDIAEQHDWILFFDEGDAIFGKRVDGGQSSNDRHSNQEIAYLLQRIERYPGMVVIATNLKSNMDKAFLRRFQCIVEFMEPNEQMRLKMWETIFDDSMSKEEGLCFEEYAKSYPLTGGQIINVFHRAAAFAYDENGGIIAQKHVAEALCRQLISMNKLNGQIERKLMEQWGMRVFH
ncbi:ATP-binding protein [Aureibacter tunicatorum]|uniref:AAA+ superfamily predicted ATPase n=1 Tax=Aureibacter tunicatorum TaxID=866807 RepID=A0AAE3XTS9_9BACT|nr:ATP-binding protein [Aureibacter tunicatorum]MDR6241741.1 AAA+ superfamily predicted ATPase [Aureibacter tunicatorum]BDD07397.1 hypothetical protein AUTU_48800 [Aureibacter tunicatorum]